jgi:dihydropteroate synthase
MEYCMKVRGVQMSLAEPVVMGILNCTPDSFYADSRKQTEQEIAERAQQILAEGGRIIDVGAYSTRPGHEVVSEEEEMHRLQAALTVIRREVPDAIVSVDTFRPLVARRCVEEWGADMVNDVSPTTNSSTERSDDRKKAMFEVVSQLDVPYVLMSQQPTIETMLSEWADDVQQLRLMGAKDIILDPGFGFGKTLDENFAVLRQMERLSVLNLPLLVGLSRKRMVWQTLNGSPETALNGTTVLNTIALLQGAHILRVHDVREAVEVVTLVHSASVDRR